MLRKLGVIGTMLSIVFLFACVPPQLSQTEQTLLQKERDLIVRERELIQRESELIQGERRLLQRERELMQRASIENRPANASVPIITGPTSGFPPQDRPLASINGEILIRVEPCVTPTAVADYRELLPAGTYSYSHDMVYYIKGYDIPGQVIPTPPPHFNDSPPSLIDPLTAQIVYTSTSSQPCD